MLQGEGSLYTEKRESESGCLVFKFHVFSCFASPSPPADTLCRARGGGGQDVVESAMVFTEKALGALPQGRPGAHAKELAPAALLPALLLGLNAKSAPAKKAAKACLAALRDAHLGPEAFAAAVARAPGASDSAKAELLAAAEGGSEPTVAAGEAGAAAKRPTVAELRKKAAAEKAAAEGAGSPSAGGEKKRPSVVRPAAPKSSTPGSPASPPPAPASSTSPSPTSVAAASPPQGLRRSSSGKGSFSTKGMTPEQRKLAKLKKEKAAREAKSQVRPGIT